MFFYDMEKDHHNKVKSRMWVTQSQFAEYELKYTIIIPKSKYENAWTKLEQGFRHKIGFTFYYICSVISFSFPGWNLWKLGNHGFRNPYPQKNCQTVTEWEEEGEKSSEECKVLWYAMEDQTIHIVLKEKSQYKKFKDICSTCKKRDQPILYQHFCQNMATLKSFRWYQIEEIK